MANDDVLPLLGAVIFLSLCSFITDATKKEEFLVLDYPRPSCYTDYTWITGYQPVFVVFLRVLMNLTISPRVIIRPIARVALCVLVLFGTNVIPFKDAGTKVGVIIQPIARSALQVLALFRTGGFHGACAAFLATLALSRVEYALGSLDLCLSSPLRCHSAL